VATESVPLMTAGLVTVGLVTAGLLEVGPVGSVAAGLVTDGLGGTVGSVTVLLTCCRVGLGTAATVAHLVVPINPWTPGGQ